ISRRGHGRRGVDFVYGRDARRPPRRTRLSLQMEFGLDARLVGFLRQGSDLAEAPHRIDYVRDVVRVRGKLYFEPWPRRGRPHEGEPAQQNAGDDRTKSRQPPRASDDDVWFARRKITI